MGSTGGNYSTGGGACSNPLTYAEIYALQQASELTPNCQYSFEHTTKHWLVDSDGNYCYDLVDAPAPGNITITPDAVGDNPVTYYYKAVYANNLGGVPDIRSLMSEELSVTIGDSTTELIFSCDAIPSWAEQLYVINGTVSEAYTHFDYVDTIPKDLVSTFPGTPYPGVEAAILALPIKQVVDEGANPIKSVITGTPEHLILTATSVNTFDKRVQSVEYPGDIIEYLIPFDFGGEILVGFQQLYDTDHFIEGYTGTITRRGDSLGNILNWDIRNVKYRLWNITQTAWDFETTYNAGEVCENNSIIYGAKIESTDVEPGVDEGWETSWDVVINTGIMGEYVSQSPTEVELNGYTLTIQDATDFQDVIAVGEGSTNNIQLTGYNIFPGIVLPAYSRNNVFNPDVLEPIFWEPVASGETITHNNVNAGVRQFYIDGSDNSMVITEGAIGMEVGG